MVKGIDGDVRRLALMMAGIDPDSFDDVTPVDEGDWCDEVTGEYELPATADIPPYDPQARSLEYLQRIVQTQHGADPFPSSHRFTALVDMQDVWRGELREGLKEATMRLTSGVTYETLTNGDADEAFMDAAPGDIAEMILCGDDVRMRILAVIVAAGFAPADGELASPIGDNALHQTFNALTGILINIDEHPLLRQAAIYAYTALMSSSLRHMFGYLKVETGSAALLMIANNPESPAFLREAAVAGLGILSETWVWRIPVALEMDGLLTGIVAAEEGASFRMAAIRAYGMAFANMFVDDPGPMLRELKAILRNKEVSALKKTARALVDAIRVSDPQLVDGIDDDDDEGSSPPAQNGSAPTSSGMPTPSTPPAGGQNAIGMMSGASLFMSPVSVLPVFQTVKILTS